MRLKTWTWLLLLVIPAPFFFNCHRGSDLSAAVETGSHGAPPAEEPPLPVHAFSESNSKVRLSPTSLFFENDSSASASSRSFKHGSGATAIVPAGLPLAILVDNDCLRMNTDASSLSSRVYAVSRGLIEGLKLQSYEFMNSQDRYLHELQAEAESDPCILSVDNNERKNLVVPYETEPAPDSGSRVAKLSLTNDPGLNLQHHHSAINAIDGWAIFYGPSRGISKKVIVAVVDTGVDVNHEDLRANLWRNSNGQVGYDFENLDGDPMDDNGHGTHVAGLVGAVANNKIGVTGVAGRSVQIMAVKVTNSDGNGHPTAIANGIRWAADQGAQIINLSMSYPGSSAAIVDAVKYATGKNIVFITSAGNDNLALSTTQIITPASYSAQIPGALTVGSFDAATGAKSNFSNHSNHFVQISAPGSTGIVSTYPGNKYVAINGTSMAAPIVAGAAALAVGLMNSEGIPYTHAQVVEAIKSHSKRSSTLSPYFQNGAMLDLKLLGRYYLWANLVDGDAGTQELSY